MTFLPRGYKTPIMKGETTHSQVMAQQRELMAAMDREMEPLRALERMKFISYCKQNKIKLGAFASRKRDSSHHKAKNGEDWVMFMPAGKYVEVVARERAKIERIDRQREREHWCQRTLADENKHHQKRHSHSH